MKEERFERVVEWEKKPDWNNIICTVLLASLSLFGIIYHFFNPNELENLRVALFTGTFFSCICIVSLIVFFSSLGKGRKVYWRRIR